MIGIKKIYLGSTPVDKLLAGTNLIYEKDPIDITPPVTTVYPSATYTYSAGQQVWLEVNEACITYYTLDGTTPTTASAVFREPFTFNETTTIKYFSVDTSGNVETVKTTVFNIEVVDPTPTIPQFPRYVRFIGYGDNTSTSTTRLVELQAMYGATNVLLNKLPISGEPVSTGGTIDKATDGLITMSGYPIWWMGAGIPTLTYDLLDWYDLTELKLWMYSTDVDPRQTKFILQVSTDNVTWATVVDYSGNTTVQPAGGWSFAL